MKVFYIYGNLPSYRKDFFTQLSTELNSIGFQMEVLYGEVANKLTKQDTSSEYIHKKFPTKFTNLKYIRLTRIKGLIEYIRKNSPDCIIMQFNQTNLTEWKILNYCKKRNIPFAFWGCNYTRSDLKSQLAILREKIYKYLYRNANVLIPYGTLYKDYLISLGNPPDKIIVAQNTINVEKITKESNLILKTHKEDDPLKILYVGALAKQKLIPSSIIAISELINIGYNIHFDIVGNGSELDSLKLLINSYPKQIRDRIVLHGAKYGNELKSFFKESDLFLMPGTGGLGVNEAMAYGLPIISTIGDETVKDLIDGNGFLLEKFGDTQEQIITIKKFYNLSQEEKFKMSKKSVENILNIAPLSNMVSKHIEAIKKMVKS